MIGEFALIARITRHLAPDGSGVAVGHGDDAAVIGVGDGAAVLTMDAIVAGRHWLPELSAPRDVGWKAVAVNCSDIAAMGADVVAAVVALHRPDSVPADEVDELYAGMAEAAETYGVALVGGDTVASAQLALSMAMLGRVDAAQAVRRSGASPGDALVCVGGLGAGAAGLAQALGTEPPEPGRADPRLLAAHRRPRALLAAGRVLAAAGATAMIDVSDGLGADLGHLCVASSVSARVDAERLPIAPGVRAAASQLGVPAVTLATGGGEDFALLAAVPRGQASRVADAAGAADGVPAAVIGELAEPGARPRAWLEAPGADPVDMTELGYQHYPGARSHTEDPTPGGQAS